jgi:hypothetical protein
MRPIAITSASKPSIAINASQRAIRAPTTPYMTSPPTSPLPSGRIVQFRPISRGEIGTGIRRCTDKLTTRPQHIRRQHRMNDPRGPLRRPPNYLLTFQPSTIGLLLRCRGSQGGLSPWKAYNEYLASMALAGGHFILVRNAVRP